jgi:hypothetical protein
MTSLFPPRESLVVTSRLRTGNSRTFFYGVVGGGGGRGGGVNSSVLDALKDISSSLLTAQMPANVSCWGYNCTQTTVITQITRMAVRGQFFGVPIPTFSMTLDTYQTVSQLPPLSPLPCKSLAEIATCPPHHFHLLFFFSLVHSLYTEQTGGTGRLTLTFRAFEV